LLANQQKEHANWSMFVKMEVCYRKEETLLASYSVCFIDLGEIIIPDSLGAQGCLLFPPSVQCCISDHQYVLMFVPVAFTNS
jgi:hypothetical protein